MAAIDQNSWILKLKKAVAKLSSVPESEWDYAQGLLKEFSFAKGEFLARAGEPANRFFFIIKGLVRYFYVTEDGREFNKHFAMEHDFAGSYSSAWLNNQCAYSIQALEQTDTVVVTRELLNNLYNRHASWERLGRLQAEYLVMKKVLREKEFLLDSAEARYRQFVREYSGLADRLPQYHIASYLGITDVALSRIRGKIKKINRG